ncbi:MAG: prolipoprotein diacylglyceryl transferase [Candidatus Omnitrophica bacterium]|nr:prolipoprotein diacylglyceryl transferase [Candidatus Omnitrophota bacterium]
MHKIAFQFGSFTITWYGILVASGFLAGLWNASRRAVSVGIAAEQVLDLGPWLVIGGILGARILYVLSYWKDYFSHQPFWEMFMVQHGGLVYYGGLIGAVLAGSIYVRHKRLPYWKTTDLLAPSIALGHAFGRVGCLMNGCCYGRPTTLPWAIHFPLDHETAGVGVHPTEIYSALANLGLYVVLAWLFRRKKYDGWIFALYLVAYSVLRGWIEMYRGDYTTYYLGGHFTPAQLVSMAVFVAGVGLLYWLPRAQHPPAKHERAS